MIMSMKTNSSKRFKEIYQPSLSTLSGIITISKDGDQLILFGNDGLPV